MAKAQVIKKKNELFAKNVDKRGNGTNKPKKKDDESPLANASPYLKAAVYFVLIIVVGSGTDSS